MEKLSKEYIIQKVEDHKDIIRSSTDELSDIFYNFRKSHPNEFHLDDESSLKVRKILHQISSELSMIGGFCDSRTQNYIDETVNIVGGIAQSTKINVLYSHILEFWAMRINSIMIDYSKTPLRLTDLKPLADLLQSMIKAIK